ncbi:UvrD-helicase domain-containing protein [Candidatus Woesearchaeota archaeon]|nr:UvrD-helicase domain-containing protein [Candidatus Woesearchaeota archaeon]
MHSQKELDYVNVLRALQEIPFCVGRKLLVDFLQGNEGNESIERNRLHKKDSFGSMAYSADELNDIIDNLMLNGMVQQASVNGNRFWKVLELSEKGKQEIDNPSLYKRKLGFAFKEHRTEITDAERKAFSAFQDFLGKYNEPQKKAVISNAPHILCVAGAGSGKTTVLTKRIEFLARYRSVDPSRILAITFTRKARREMMNRLAQVPGLDTVKIETFNSFCEKMLKRHNDKAYDLPVRVVSYRDKVQMMNRALQAQNLSMHQAIDLYFTQAQQRAREPEKLAHILMNDCFFIRDYFKSKGKAITPAEFDAFDVKTERSVRMVVGICNYLDTYMKKNGLRDFADQLMDALSLFETHPELIPRFDHILIDEYQDVNSTQIRLVDMLNSPNIFCVGDPRQSIYGWRGSDIRFIINFEEKYPGCEVVTLTRNYRSTPHIVNLANSAIKGMGLADLESASDGEKDVHLISFDTEQAEMEFIIQAVTASKLPRNEIFVLARTNRQLNELSDAMKQRGIKHVVRSDEVHHSIVAGPDDLTLATVHAIKGMEAGAVFVMGCNGVNFPCKGSEHPIIDMVKVEEYDKEEEERRLFYVAISRARKSLYISYSGKKPTSFITQEMIEALNAGNGKQKSLASESSEKEKAAPVKTARTYSGGVMDRLREWRRDISKSAGVPAFMILHDRTLIDIVEKMPLSVEDLEDVHGLGPTKISKYGDEIIRVVNG